MTCRPASLEPALTGRLAAEAKESVRVPVSEEGFTAFYQRTARQLTAYLRRVSGNPALAEDLAQESYLRFLSARAPWEEGEESCRRYLFRIATNLMRDQWRRPAARSLGEVPERALPFVDPPPVESLDSARSDRVLGAALLTLRPAERQLLWLAHAEGMTHREIAAITGYGTARIRLALYRSRHKLARALRREQMTVEARP